MSVAIGYVYYIQGVNAPTGPRYFGLTETKLGKAISQYRRRNRGEDALYNYIDANGGSKNFEMGELQAVENTTRDALRDIVQKHIDQHRAAGYVCLNDKNATLKCEAGPDRRVCPGGSKMCRSHPLEKKDRCRSCLDLGVIGSYYCPCGSGAQKSFCKADDCSEDEQKGLCQCEKRVAKEDCSTCNRCPICLDGRPAANNSDHQKCVTHLRNRAAHAAMVAAATP